MDDLLYLRPQKYSYPHLYTVEAAYKNLAETFWGMRIVAVSYSEAGPQARKLINNQFMAMDEAVEKMLPDVLKTKNSVEPNKKVSK